MQAILTWAAHDKSKSSWLEDSHALFPNLYRRHILVPILAHEMKAIRWVGYKQVNRFIGHLSYYVTAITTDNSI